MKANFIRKLCEAEMNKTEVALCVGSIGDQLQSMIEKLSNIKIKDVEELVKKSNIVVILKVVNLLINQLVKNWIKLFNH